MKKYLHIPLAIFLIAFGIWGCTLNRSRPVLTCFPTDDWTAVSGTHILPGESSSDGPFVIPPEALTTAMDDVHVRPRSSFSDWTCETIFLHIQAEDITLSMEIGENGDLTIAELAAPEETMTCWRADDPTLYQNLLVYLIK